MPPAGGGGPATVPLREDEFLPELFHAADRVSGSGQRRHVRATAAQLLLLLVAATVGAFSLTFEGSSTDWAQVASAAAFFSTAIIKIYTLTTKPDVAWYQGRAVAESAKTLAWLFAVGGGPFGREAEGERDPTELFLERLRDLRASVHDVALVPLDTRMEQITHEMRRIRDLPLEARKDVYRSQRIEDQARWYAGKARVNMRRGRAWGFGMLGFEIAGGLLALLEATGVSPLSLSGLTATVVGAVAAWMQTKQHESLATAYSVTARELADIRSLMDRTMTEEEWASFVEDAESAISREHTLWRASRGV